MSYLAWIQTGLPINIPFENIPTSAVAVVLFFLWRDVSQLKADVSMLKMNAGIVSRPNSKKEAD